MLNQFTKPVLRSLIAIWAISVMVSVAVAQTPLPPAVSPWMGMFDRSRGTSTLDNYTRNVKPQQDAMRAFASQANQIQSQQQMLRSLQAPGSSGSTPLGSAGSPAVGGASSMREILAPPREIPSAQRNPAGFNQYLHYYPAGGMPRRPVPNFSTTGRRR